MDGDFLRVNKEDFIRCPSDSIDYAVMERLDPDNSALPPGMLIPLSAGWSDVGAWDSLWQVLPKDAQGNVAQGDVLLHECNNTLVMSEHRLVACVGVEDMVVVETPDAVLVAHMRETQHVKKVVDSLKRQGRPEGELHRKVFRPWGWYDGVDAGERFSGKTYCCQTWCGLVTANASPSCGTLDCRKRHSSGHAGRHKLPRVRK